MTEADEISASHLTHDITTDVCIIGGGFTGLWTAINLRLIKPELGVVIIEKDLCGQGASGRNGGAMLIWSTKFCSLIKQVGLERAMYLVKASEQAVHDIKAFTEKYGIDCDCRVDGTFYTASNASQQNVFKPVLDLLETHQLNTWQSVTQDKFEMTGSKANLSAIFSPHAGSVQPAKLVRGLFKVAKQLGVKIYERTKYIYYQGDETLNIKTDRGMIKNRKLVFAVNAWLPKLESQFARFVVLVSSDMVISKANPAAINAMGLNHGAPVIDSRIFVNYYRTTTSGRLMLGKGGNYFSFANHVSNRFDQPSQYLEVMKYYWQYFFQHSGLEIERSWTRPSDRSVSGLPFFGELKTQKNIYYGSGYSGNVVVQSYLGGNIPASLILNKADKWRDCGLVNQPLAQFPVEPVRTLGAYMVRNAIRRKEYAEDLNKHASPWDSYLSKLSGSAAKADTSLNKY